MSGTLTEPSATVRERIVAARAIQRTRFEGTSLQINADSAKTCAALLPPRGIAEAIHRPRRAV